jgi:succinylglutamate desuccinylase
MFVDRADYFNERKFFLERDVFIGRIRRSESLRFMTSQCRVVLKIGTYFLDPSERITEYPIKMMPFVPQPRRTALFAVLWTVFCVASLAIAVPRVVIVGGTHGNEYTGVWCIKSLQQRADFLKERYPRLDVSTLLGNPEAHFANRRFVDTDLNREFHFDRLCSVDDVDEDEGDFAVESIRARELNEIIGSKCSDSNEESVDVAIDLHSTTSNMGTTLIFNEGDVLMAHGAAYVAQQCPNVNCLMHAIPDRNERPNLSSAAKHGFTIEVGPVPQGLLRHDAVLKTECALFALLDFLQRHYSGESEKLLLELKKLYPSGKVPTFRTVPAQRPGEMSGKIVWPSDEENPNFPKWMIHSSVQDKDYQLLRTGDPLFVQLDGSVIHYDGAYGDEIYLLFINEGGYYYSSSGTGISVARLTNYDLIRATFEEEGLSSPEVESTEAKQEL